MFNKDYIAKTGRNLIKKSPNDISKFTSNTNLFQKGK